MKKFRTSPYNDEKKQTQLLTLEDEIIKEKIANRQTDFRKKSYLKNRAKRLGFQIEKEN